MIRHFTAKITLAIVLLASVLPATVAVANPTCIPPNQGWLNSLNDNGSTWWCEWTIYHGNYGTVGYSQASFDGGYGTSYSCTSASAQVVSYLNGNYYVGTRAYDYVNDNQALTTSAIGAGYYLLGSNHWATRPGIYDAYYSTGALGC